MRISDWSSDVCSSDLRVRSAQHFDPVDVAGEQMAEIISVADAARVVDLDPVDQHQSLRRFGAAQRYARHRSHAARPAEPDRKSVVSGKSVSVRVDLGGRRIIKNKNKKKKTHQH